MDIILGSLLLLVASLLQSTLVNRILLLQGSADLILLVLLGWILHNPNQNNWRWGMAAGLIFSLFSALPFWVPLLGYGLAAFVGQFLQLRVWQSSLLTLFTSTVIGTVLVHGVSLVYFWVSARPLDTLEALNLVTVPSIVLNMISALPIYALMGEMAKLALPFEPEQDYR